MNPDGLSMAARWRLFIRRRGVRRAWRSALWLAFAAVAVYAANAGYALARDFQEFTAYKQTRAEKQARLQKHSKDMFDELCVNLAPHKKGSRAEKICTAIVEESLIAGIEPADGMRLVKLESNFILIAKGAADDYGLTQTRRAVHQPTVACDLAMDARCNLRTGFAYYRSLLIEFGGDKRLAALAYNRGPHTVRTLLRAGIDPANGYWQRWQGVDV